MRSLETGLDGWSLPRNWKRMTAEKLKYNLRVPGPDRMLVVKQVRRAALRRVALRCGALCCAVPRCAVPCCAVLCCCDGLLSGPQPLAGLPPRCGEQAAGRSVRGSVRMCKAGGVEGRAPAAGNVAPPGNACPYPKLAPANTLLTLLASPSLPPRTFPAPPLPAPPGV